MARIGILARIGWRSVVTVVLIVSLIAPLAAARDAAAQTDRHVSAEAAPATTALYLEIDLDLEGMQWQQAETLLARAGLPNALDLGQNAMLQESAPDGDLSAADLDALFGGEMAIVVSPEVVRQHMAGMHAPEGSAGSAVATPVMPAAVGPHGIAAVLVPGDLDAAWNYVDRQITSLAVNVRAPVRETTYNGADLLVVEPPAMGHDAGMGMAGDHSLSGMMDGFGMHGPGGLAVARAGNFIVTAKTEEDVTDIVDVIDGTTESLADTTPFANVGAELPGDTLSFTYVNGPAIVDALGPEMAQAMQSMMPEMSPQAWLTYSGFAISADESGFRFDSITIPVAGGSLAGMSVPNDPAAMTAAMRAPADTFAFQAGVLPENALAGLPYALAAAVNDAAATGGEAMAQMPTAEEIDAQISQASAVLDFDLRTDLVALLGNEYVAFASLPSFELGGIGLDAAAAITTTDPDALAETARKLAAWIDRAQFGVDITVRQAGENAVYIATNTEDEDVPPVEFGVVDGEAIVGAGGGIDQLTSPSASTLADDAQFQTVMGLLPAENYQVSYVDIGQAIDLVSMLFGLVTSPATVDADAACERFAGQDQAQAAYDEDPVANAILDVDFDGVACEDAFPSAEANGASTAGNPGNIRAFGSVAFQRGDAVGSSAILYIPLPGS
jgi:hypothetical protein